MQDEPGGSPEDYSADRSDSDGSAGDERRLAVGGVFDRRAGCLLVPFIPVRAGGALILTTRRLIFEPVLHYKLFARRTEIPLEEVAGAETVGRGFGFNLQEIFAVGKNLKITFKSGRSKQYRSTEADMLADEINRQVVTRERPTASTELPPEP